MGEAPLPADVDPQARLDRLRASFRRQAGVLVAYSGGVDSALLAKVAADVLGPRALAVVVDSESYARRELEGALAFAREAGFAVEVVRHSELADPEYAANPTNRCYFCRKGMAEVLRAEADRRGLTAIAVGTNVDDLSEWRPGLAALREAGAWSPLLEVEATKEDVRAMARLLGLSVAEKPSMACLSSRVPHGEAITIEKLRRIEAAEETVRGHGFRQVRVRSVGDLARIEVEAGQVQRLVALLDDIAPRLRELGYARVEADLAGYRSGSLTLKVRAGAPG